MIQSNTNLPHMVISTEVLKALKSNEPVVALESTIISHGMPFPQNLHTAMAVEQIIRKHHVTPATIAILKGIIHIGLTSEELEFLARAGNTAHKCSRRDLPYVISQEKTGATTVAATMFLANKAGIKIFVTGGIGGVHRNWEDMDISADLTELQHTPVTVVCAGVKSILDIPRTLEYLETQGVPVVSLGEKEFPAFFTRKSGVDAPFTVNSPAEIARMTFISNNLDMSNGIIVGVPIPKTDEAEFNKIQQAITQALTDCSTNNIKGRQVTPFLLSRVNELTHGKSLEANIKLVMNNAKIGAQIAIELTKLKKIF